METIGKYALVYNEEMTAVTLNPNGVSVEEGALAYCTALEKIVNLDKATYVGDYSFAYTSVVEADLASATYVGTQAFLKETMTGWEIAGCALMFIAVILSQMPEKEKS